MLKSLSRFSIATLLTVVLGVLAIPPPAAAQNWATILNYTYGATPCTWIASGTYAACGIDWSASGIPGGIPSSTWTQSGSTIAATSGDRTSTIQTALNACGTNHYVLLGAGTFNVTNLIIPSNCVLRGLGANLTILNATGSGGAVVALGSASAIPSAASAVAISSGATAGSTSLTLSSASGISTGMYLVVNELNYNPLVTLSGGPGGGNCTFCYTVFGLTYNNGEVRARGQIEEVTNVAGNVVTVTPPLYSSYSNTLPDFASSTTYGYGAIIKNGSTTYVQIANNGSPYTCVSGSSFNTGSNGTCNWSSLGSGTTTAPMATPFTASAKYAGVEALQIFANNTGYGQSIACSECAYSWVKGVEGNYTDGDHMDVQWGYRGEVRDSYFSNAFLHTSGSHDSDVSISYATTGFRVENNILERLHVSVILGEGAAGNVIAYNYMIGNFDTFATNFTINNVDAHTAHTQFNLVEGNVMAMLAEDSTWGSHSHGTQFRNWFVGTQDICNPTTSGRATVNCAPFGVPGAGGVNSWLSFQANRAQEYDYPDNYFNTVGNVVGSSAAQTAVVNTSNNPLSQTASISWPSSRAYDTVVYGFSCGFSGSSDSGTFASDSTRPCQTTLTHGDYNNISSTTTWTGAIPHTLPFSFYLAGKPTWWPAALAFPSIGPESLGAGPGGHIANVNAANPAQACYLGVMGGNDGGNGSPLTFNAETCYPSSVSPPGPPPASLIVATPSLPTGTIALAYSKTTLTASGGTPPYTWSGSSFPSGLSLSAAGVLSGTPTVSGNFSAGVKVRDAAGVTASVIYPLTISPATPPPPPPPPPPPITSKSWTTTCTLVTKSDNSAPTIACAQPK